MGTRRGVSPGGARPAGAGARAVLAGARPRLVARPDADHPPRVLRAPSYVPLLRRAFELWREPRGADRRAAAARHRRSRRRRPREATCSRGRAVRAWSTICAHEILWRGPTCAGGFRRGTSATKRPRCSSPTAGFSARELRARPCLAGETAGRGDSRARAALSWEARSGRRAGAHGGRTPTRPRQLVLAAGAWMGTLLPDLARLMRPERQVLGWFAIGNAAAFAPERFPVFVHEAEEGVFYGFPEFEVARLQDRPLSPSLRTGQPRDLDRACRPDDEAALRAAVARYFPERRRPAGSRQRLPVHQHPRRALHHRPPSRGRARCSSCRRAPGTASSSAAWSARSWPTW